MWIVWSGPFAIRIRFFEYVDSGSGSTMLVIVQAPMFHNRSDAFRVQGLRVIVKSSCERHTSGIN